MYTCTCTCTCTLYLCRAILVETHIIQYIIIMVLAFLCIHMQSPDWDSRVRSVTAPIDPNLYSSPLPVMSVSHPVPIPDSVADLPPLPGESMDMVPPPPLPKRGEVEDSMMYPPPVPRKGHTLPRKTTHHIIIY